VIAALWAILLLVSPMVVVWLYLPVTLLVAGRFHGLGVILHDAAHLPPRRSIQMSLVEALAGYPLATTIAAMRYHHLRHHRENGRETDPYLKPGRQTALWWILHVLRGLLLLPAWTGRALVGVASLVVPGLRPFYARVCLQEREPGDFVHSAEVIACARAEVSQLVFQVALLVAAILSPVPVLLGYVVPASITGVLAAYRLLKEHSYELASQHSMETVFATTRDNHLGWWGKILLAPRNVGHHVVHHLHPQVGLTRLPALREWYVTTQPELYRVNRPD
jgi:fatty acid desaturase